MSEASGNPTLSAAKIHLLDLGVLRERLGPKWERMAEHVQLFFEAAIRRTLTPGDTFLRFGELNYLVLFSELSAPEAELKCAAISEEVCRRLFGENGVEVSLRNLIAPVPRALAAEGPEQKESLNAALERDGKERVIVRQQPAAADATHAKPIRVTLGGKPPRRQFVCLPETQFVYRPVWDLLNNAVLTYLCQPVAPQAATEAAPFGFWTAEEEQDQAELDLHILRECVERANGLRTQGRRIIFAIPVHFTTVARPRSWRDYNDVLQLALAEIRRDLAFLIFGIDRGVPHVRLGLELPKLSRMAYRVFCAVESAHGASGKFAKTGAHGIGIALSGKEDELEASALLKEIGREASAAALEAFVLGLPSTSLVLMSAHARIRYMEGPVVRPAVADPQHGFAQGIEDLYRAKLAG